MKKYLTIRKFFSMYFNIDDKNLDRFTHEDITTIYGYIGQLEKTTKSLVMCYNDEAVRVMDANEKIMYYRNPLKNNIYVRDLKIKEKEKKKVLPNINIDQLDNLSIYQLVSLLEIVKYLKQETEKRIIVKRLRKKSLIVRGNKKKILEKVRKEENNYD